LLPGGYAQVHLLAKITGARLQVPVNALLFRSEGLRAVVIDADHKAHLKPLTIGRDYGITLEVLQGLDASDWIVLNPADSLDEGVQVNVKEVPPGAGPDGQPANGTGATGGNTPPTSEQKHGAQNK
jgi:multidrug efflux system membrane fusion protein